MATIYLGHHRVNIAWHVVYAVYLEIFTEEWKEELSIGDVMVIDYFLISHLSWLIVRCLV